MKRDWADVDFVARGLPRWVGWALLAVGAASLAGLAWEVERRSAELAALEQRLAGSIVPAAPRAALAPRASTGEDAALRQALAVRWQALFTAVETPAPAGVVLLALEPDVAAGMVRIAVQAPDLAAGGAYLAHLQAVGLKQPRLVSHQALDPSGAGGGPVRLAVQALWRPHGD
ncbi:hypothetical protein OOT46_26010 [Aquabacterium sp. A7-Y]|uniref:hypothetical protein n=1 Tax=Aquabacterium sp. A7-Y TaxID=1349605 RepID=UPI00223D3668|nr:hypothetical protein [Aquabacterium sp. A7-Y]MCW7541270.1 hypothetical protein [Aquabacterium sp. A7-Y]